MTKKAKDKYTTVMVLIVMFLICLADKLFQVIF